MARPTKYNPKIAEEIFSLFRADTYTVAEVCRMVKIAPSTFYSWCISYLDFSDAIKKAQEARTAFFVSEAKKSLLKKIQGYTVQEKHVTTTGSGKFDANGREIPKIEECKTIERYIKPKTTAIIFTLCSLDPENWKNRQNTEVTGKDGKDFLPARVLTKEEAYRNGLFSLLSDEDLDKLIELNQKTPPRK